MPMTVTKEMVKPLLIDSNRDYMGRSTWQQAFGDVQLQADRAKQQVTGSYDNALADAYISSLQQGQQLLASSLGTGFKEAALKANERTLEDAFESYKANYLSQMQEIDTSAAQATSQIRQALDAQASNVAKYTGYAFDYLPYLYEKDQSLFEKDPALARFVNRDENGAITGLKSIDELQEGMFNKDGSMTEAGIDFLNMVQNYGRTGNLGQNTFTQFLSEKDKGLLEWLSSADPYSAGKTNRDTFNDIAGTNSNPYGLTLDKLSKDNLAHFQTSYNATHDSLVETYKSGHKSLEDATTFIEKQDTATKELIEFAKRIGVASDSELSKLISDAEKNMIKYKDTIENDTTGTNRKNREWATSNALADYENLYAKVMELTGGSAFEQNTERSTYRQVERYAGDEKYNDVLVKHISIRDDTDLYNEPAVVMGKNNTHGSMTVYYTQSGKGKESVAFGWDPNKPIANQGFKSVKTFERRTDSVDEKNRAVTSSGKTKYEIGVLTNGEIAIKYNGKIYKATYSNTSDNAAFIDYLKVMSSH